jgi:hypothetical protein
MKIGDMLGKLIITIVAVLVVVGVTNMRWPNLLRSKKQPPPSLSSGEGGVSFAPSQKIEMKVKTGADPMFNVEGVNIGTDAEISIDPNAGHLESFVSQKDYNDWKQSQEVIVLKPIEYGVEHSRPYAITENRTLTITNDGNDVVVDANWWKTAPMQQVRDLLSVLHSNQYIPPDVLPGLAIRAMKGE